MSAGYGRKPNKPHRQRRRGMTLIELIAFLFFVFVLVVVALLLLLPSVSPSCALSPKHVCACNLRHIGTSMAIYASDAGGMWAVPLSEETGVGRIKYTGLIGGGKGTPASPSRTQPSTSGPGGARELSPTRAFWALVSSGDCTVKEFICPSSGDVLDETEHIDAYYDFTAYENVSYGYQLPFGPVTTQPREGADNRLPLAADKGPYISADVPTPPAGLGVQASARKWAAYNSPNHGREGQNVLFADGHVSFQKTPIVGIDHDNIYTIALDNIHTASRTAGESPWRRNAYPFAPVNSLGQAISSTDSVIFP